MSDLRRFFVDKICDSILIDGEEFRHATNVLRIKEGEQIIVCDNSGLEYVCTVDKINKNNLQATINEKRKGTSEATEKVLLICGYLKGVNNGLS